MTCMDKLANGDDIVASAKATWGPETEFGFPVFLDIKVELKKGEDGEYGLSVVGGMKVKQCEKLCLTAIDTCGQCRDTIRSALTENNLCCALFDAIEPIWKKWHLNGMCAGTPDQEACIEKYYEEHPEDKDQSYERFCRILEENGLMVDSSVVVDGHPYKYGSSWLRKKIPQEILESICRLMDGDMVIVREEA